MYISVDVGATNIGIASSNSLKEPKFGLLTKIDIKDNYHEDLESIANELSSVKNIEGLALGIPGRLNETKTRASIANIKSWSGRDIKNDFENRFDCSVALENDAALAALGEGVYGRGKNKDFVFLIWGTGVGGTRIQHKDGELNYFPFEPGHDFVIEVGGRKGSCGHKGDLEAYVGGSSIESFYRKTADRLSRQEWEEVISYFSKGIEMILENHPFDLIVFGGSVALGQEDKIQRIEKEVRRKFPSIQLALSTLEGNAGIYGGFALLERQRN